MIDKIKMPHTLVLLFIMMALALIATWLLPQGQFQSVLNDAGRSLVVPGTYEVNNERVVLPIWVLATAIPRALAQAQDIIFFILIVGGAIAVLRSTGAIDAFLGAVLKKIGHSPALLISLGMGVFAAGSATLGVAEEYIPFTLILISLCIAMRMDAVTAIGIMVGGYGIGYGVAALNPFTVLIAQSVADIPPTSGLWFRLLIFLPFLAIGIHHVWSYANKVRKDANVEVEVLSVFPEMNKKHMLVLSLTILTLFIMAYGIAQKGWYIAELGALFLTVAVVVGLVGGLGVNSTALRFSEGAAELASTALLIGFARSIALILEDGQVLHTVVHGLSIPLQSMGAELGAVSMLVIQTIINFFIPSGSGQAYVTMPIMAPIGDIIGVSRQVSVLAFQFGDGFANMIVPTNPVLMGILGIAGISYARWFRFIAPLLLKLLAAGAVTLVIGVWIDLA